MYEVQHTGRPYGPAERIAESAWRPYCQRRSLRAARRIAADLCRVPGDPGAWGDQARVILTPRSQPVTLRVELVCGGYYTPRGHDFAPNCPSVVIHGYVWQPGGPAPLIDDVLPEGWPTPSQCAACHACEQASEES